MNAGWVSMDFNNPTEGTELDQAYVSYQFNGGAAFISAHVPGVQLDPSACEPLGLQGLVNPVIPTIPGGVLGDGNPIPPIVFDVLADWRNTGPSGHGRGFNYRTP